jgi:hypothetical protein
MNHCESPYTTKRFTPLSDNARPVNPPIGQQPLAEEISFQLSRQDDLLGSLDFALDELTKRLQRVLDLKDPEPINSSSNESRSLLGADLCRNNNHLSDHLYKIQRILESLAL